MPSTDEASVNILRQDFFGINTNYCNSLISICRQYIFVNQSEAAECTCNSKDNIAGLNY